MSKATKDYPVRGNVAAEQNKVSENVAPPQDYSPGKPARSRSGGVVKAKVTQIGNSLGLILNRETTSRLNLAKGDTVAITETREGFSVSVYDPEFDRQMGVAKDVMARYRNALKELAK
jgi:putative addiction module antidote